MINNPIITTENESFQMIVASKEAELQSMSEMKKERMKELESIQERKSCVTLWLT